VNMYMYMRLMLVVLPVIVASSFSAFAYGWSNKNSHRSSPHRQQATTTTTTAATSSRKGYYCLSRMMMTMDPENNQDDDNTTFDLKKLMSACIYLARRGGDIIKEEHNKGIISLNAHNKKTEGDTRTVTEMEAHEVLTVADGRAQDAIITSLRSLFGPNLRIVGEEGECPEEELATKWSDIINDDEQLQHAALLHPFNNVPLQLKESLTAADVCLWIDPLDGTKEFVLGNLTNVSVLIGIAVCDRPVAGVILQPFVGGGDVTYGAIGVGVFHNGDKIEADRIKVDDDDDKDKDKDSSSSSDDTTTIRIAISGKHIGDGGRLNDAIDRLNDVDVDPSNNNSNTKPYVQVLPLNACGNKMLRVIRGDASVHLQGPGASRWDTCAGEALLMALGGVVTSLDGLPYQYIQDSCYDNADGFVAARTPELHSRLVQALVCDQ
jgi:3'(2'), 5'-bisphosphate nucleotidase